MKFRRLLCMLLCLLLIMQAAVTAVLAEEQEDASVTKGCRGIDSFMPLLGNSQFTDNAQAIMLLEAGTDTIMYAWNQDQQLHPAGLVKILTALLVIENCQMSEIVTVPQSVVDSISKDARTTDLQPDEVLTVEQLVHCVLVQGSNDAAAALAHHVSGSQEGFVQLMNDYAKELGCANTVFKNPHGLHDVEQLSTARDMARILDKAIENEQFKTIFGTTHYTVEKTNKSEERNLESSNHMMHQEMYEIYYDERITGGRTGVNNTGLRCIATTSSQGDMELICVILGSESVINDRGIVEKIGGFYETSDLLDFAFDGYKTAQVICADQAIKQFETNNGSADVVAAPSVDIYSVVPSGATSDSLKYRYNDVKGALDAPIRKGQKLSTVEIWSGNVCIAQADLYALNDVSENRQIIHHKENSGLSGWWIFLIILLVLAVLVVITLFVIRFTNLRMKRSGRTRNTKRIRKQRREQ